MSTSGAYIVCPERRLLQLILLGRTCTFFTLQSGPHVTIRTPTPTAVGAPKRKALKHARKQEEGTVVGRLFLSQQASRKLPASFDVPPPGGTTFFPDIRQLLSVTKKKDSFFVLLTHF